MLIILTRKKFNYAWEIYLVVNLAQAFFLQKELNWL